MPFTRGLPRLSLITCALLILCSAARAQYPVYKIVDTSTPIPGGNGQTFRSFDLPVAERQITLPMPPTQVLFRATGPDGYEGIFRSRSGPDQRTFQYHHPQVLQTVADTRTPMPGFTGNFTRISLPSIRDELLTFVGQGDEPAERAVYSNYPTPLSLVAKHGEPRDGGGTFDQFSDPSIGSGVAFRDGTGSSQAIYRQFFLGQDGTPTVLRVVGVGDPIPGSSSTFAHVGTPNVFFYTVYSGRNEEGSVKGVYYTSGVDPAQGLADLNTQIPGGSGTFTGFSDPVIDVNTLIFKGTGPDGQQGIYSAYARPIGQRDPLQRVIDLTGEAPGYPGLSIVELGDPSAATGLGWTAKLSDGRTVLYLERGPSGTPAPLFDTTRLLDGKEVASISIGRESVHSEAISFLATFADGSQGIYTATIPEPATGLLMLAWLPLLLRRRGR